MMFCPSRRKIVAGISYFLVAFYVFPYVGVLFAQDESQMLYGVWIDLFYHWCNFLVILILFLPYLKGSVLQTLIYRKVFWSTVGILTAIIVAYKIGILFLADLSGNILFGNSAFGSLLTSEMDLQWLSAFLLMDQPVWGTLVFVLACPVTISCLLYSCVFAPVCINRPRLAYVVMVGVLILLRALMIFCRWSADQQIVLFLITLPVHLLACLSYHITDTVWAPIAVHSFSNLSTALLVHLFFSPVL